jgi:hypothetical protein
MRRPERCRIDDGASGVDDGPDHTAVRSVDRVNRGSDVGADDDCTVARD